MSRFYAAAVLLVMFFLVLHVPVLKAAERSPATSADSSAEKTSESTNSTKAVGHRKEISVFALSADGRYAVTGDREENNYLWDVKTGNLIHSIGRPDKVRIWVVAAGFSPDASKLLWARYRKYMPVLWDVQSRKRLGVLASKEKGHLAEINSLAYSGDGQYVVTGDALGTIVLWNMKDKTPVRRFKAHAGKVSSLLFIPGRGEFISAGDDGSVRLWKIDSPIESILKEPGSVVTALAVSADGKILYAASGGGEVRGWNLALRSLRATIKFDNRQINGISISPDGDFIALVAENESVLVWNVHESKVAWKNRLDNSALQITFSPDGKSLFTSGGDRWIREWEASSGRPVRKFAGVAE